MPPIHNGGINISLNKKLNILLKEIRQIEGNYSKYIKALCKRF